MHRLPAVYAQTGYIDADGLAVYAPDIHHMIRRAAHYVDRILKGAKPGDLPIEQPTTFELVINLKTSRPLTHLGLSSRRCCFNGRTESPNDPSDSLSS